MASGTVPRDFLGRTAVITGAASGIGRAAVELFADRGANVVAVDVDDAAAGEIVGTIEDRGAAALFLRADLTDEAQVEAMMVQTLARFGRVDCAFNNAGVSGVYGAFHELTLAEWHRVIDIDLTSVFLCMKHEIAHMRGQGGAIVNTSSGAGVIPAPGNPHYTAAKHGVLGLTKVAAREYASAGIRVNAICPGVTDTALVRDFIDGRDDLERMMLATAPAGRMATPEEVAEAALWLCSDGARFVSGDSLFVDGASVCR